MDTQLTPAELDVLLEAARAATPGPWDYHGYSVSYHIARISDGHYHESPRVVHATLGQSVFDADNVETGAGGVRKMEDARFIAAANPATITRLVLMVRELEAKLKAEQKDHELTIDTFRQQERIWQQKNLEADTAVEHFRARAVRAIAKRASNLQTESSNPSFFDGYRQKMREQAEAVAECADLIESLPLVETEGE